MKACLRSWAILAWLDGEQPALSRVESTLTQRPIVSWVNLARLQPAPRSHSATASPPSSLPQHDATLLTGGPELVGLTDPPCDIEDLRAA